jgi:hypothetical protein
VPTPLTDAVRRVVDDVIGPAAFRADDDAVPRGHLDALAPSGLFGASVDPGVAPADWRAAQEVLAGGCLATWFVQAQHHSPVRLVDAGPPEIKARLQPLLTSGTTIAGIAFSHLRRWPSRPVEAQRTDRGWCFRGTAPWYSGWGINDVAVIGGVSEGGDVVFGLVPAEASARLRPGAPLDTAALAGVRTVPLHLDGVHVHDDGILQVLPVDRWQREDEQRTANGSPAVFGVTEAALRLLASGREQAARDAASRLSDRLVALRAECYRLLDDVPPAHMLDRRLSLRADAISLCLQATQAAVVAGGGRSMLRADRAQLYARWSLLLAVQAQTAPLRTALLSRGGPTG